MKIATMKIIDKYVGMPLSVLLLLYEYLKRIFIKRTKPEKIRKILLMKFFGMGSIILSTPLIGLLRERFPDSEITLLTFHQNKELTEVLNLADKYYFLRTKTFSHFMIDVLKTIIFLRTERYDVVFDLEFFSNFSLTMSYLSGARWRVGYYVRGTARGYILNSAVYFNQLKHVTEVFAMLFTGLDGNQTQEPHIKLDLTPFLKIGRDESILKELCSLNNSNPKIVINVNASELCKERRWPAENFIKLSEYLIINYNANLIFIGADSDREYVRSIVERLNYPKNVYDLSGRTNITDLFNIILGSDMLITNDSGPLHLASSLGKPTVSFFGPETPILYGPVNGRHLVFYKNIYCSPCLNVYNAKTSSCNGNNLCMKEISVDEVISKVSEVFQDILEGGRSDT